MLWLVKLSLQLLDPFWDAGYKGIDFRTQSSLKVGSVLKSDCQTPTATAPSSKLPDYFDTTLGWYAGPTATGPSPWLAQTNAAPFVGVSYIPNTPLETQAPIPGNKHGYNIFERLGHMSPYFPNPRGFGVHEYPVPPGANVTWLNMIHRHGSRYPEVTGNELRLAQKLTDAKGKYQAHGALSFLNDWRNVLGAEILVPVGKQQLFDSGTLHYYQYGHLYPNDGSKIIARTTTQRRMLESAEYFMAGFFGLGWTQNATLELVIESKGFNNTLAGYKGCNRTSWDIGGKTSREWAETYLQDAHQRIRGNITGGLDWTLSDTYSAQTLCAYETVAVGFSHWCNLFTYEEWEAFEYSLDIAFAAGTGFLSPIGRAIGIGYVSEVLARMQHHVLSSPTALINTTLDNNTVTFPTQQALNLDFSHDSNIISILVAFGLTQFAEYLPPTRILPEREFVMAYIEPFAGRLDIEVIQAPAPINPSRSVAVHDLYEDGPPTSYVHFVLNQRTVPLGKSLKECGNRDDGWCEMTAFLEVQKVQVEKADFEWACFGDYEMPEYGTVSDGRPPSKE
ncbi:hypothetical protein DPSP01_009312 [Paraphaeosphaeria sporulosa]